MALNNKVKMFIRIFVSSLLLLTLLVGCSIIGVFEEVFSTGKTISEPPSEIEADGQAEDSPIQSPTEIPIQYGAISIWLPQEFDPNADSESAKLINTHLHTFLEKNPGVDIDIRIKATRGSNSVLDSLSITSSAAPEILPTIALLSRADMEEAVNRGLIRPIDLFTSALEHEDWFPFAKEMGVYHNETFGLPFAADVIVMATNRTNLSDSYQSLSILNKRLGRIGYAAGSSDSLIPFVLYQSGGGALMDDNKQPTLEVEPVSSLLREIQNSKRLGIFSADLYEYQSDEQIWYDFTDRNFDSIFTWTTYASLNSKNYSIKHIPGIGENPFTYANGWIWCLVQKDSTDTEINIAFMEHMVSPDIQSEWTPMAGLMPVRPSSILEYEEEQDLINQILLSARLLPDQAVRSSLNELLANAVEEMMLENSNVEASTQKLVDQLEGIQTP